MNENLRKDKRNIFRRIHNEYYSNSQDLFWITKEAKKMNKTFHVRREKVSTLFNIQLQYNKFTIATAFVSAHSVAMRQVLGLDAEREHNWLGVVHFAVYSTDRKLT